MTKTEVFIEEAVKVHGNYYDYSLASYSGSKKKLDVICRKHGAFKITPNAHISHSQGCYKCGLIRGSNKRKQATKNKEASTHTKLCIKCNVAKSPGEFHLRKEELFGVRGVCKMCRNKAAARKKFLKKPLPVFQTHKICPSCGKCLPVLEFGPLWLKRLWKCKSCVSAWREANKDALRKMKSNHYTANIDKLKVVSKERSKSPVSSTYISKILPADEPEDRGGVLYVSCKNCRVKFSPTKIQVANRIKAVNTSGNKENNFYCSENCKDTCNIFRQRTRKKSEALDTKARVCQKSVKEALLENQCGDAGFQYCERCGEPAALEIELHHTRMVQDKEEENNPAGHLLLCYKCHKELHNECR